MNSNDYENPIAEDNNSVDGNDADRVETSADESTACLNFGERLGKARDKASMTQQALADAIGVSKAAISRWEAGTREPGMDYLAKLSETLGVTTDYLLGLSDSDGSVMSINDRAMAILKRVREQGDEQALFFETTFSRYIEQISLLKKVKKAIDDKGVLLDKVNVKGESNQASNPALKDYVSLSAQANNTGKLLIRFLKEPLDDDDTEKDELALFLTRR